MKPSTLLAAAALLALAACGQSATETTTATATTPSDLKSQVEAMAPEQQPVFAWQQLVAYQTAHPDATPACSKVRRAASQGVVPANVDPKSIYAQYAGQLVFEIQCGQQLTTVHDDPHEHWLVIFAPGATAANVAHCVDAHGGELCARIIPTVTAPTTTP